MTRHVCLLLSVALAGCSSKGEPTHEEKTPHKTAPREAKKPSPELPAPKDDRPAAFDPDDGERTVRWLYERSLPLYASPGNAIAYNKAKARFLATVATMKGKEIRWPVKVSSIMVEGILVHYFEHPQVKGGLMHHYENPDNAPKGTFPAVEVNFPVLFKPRPNGEWVERLRTSDVVVARGRIDDVKTHFIDGSPERGWITFALTLGDPTATPHDATARSR